MPDIPEVSLLSKCRLEIERAWNDARDDAPVHRLALAHPEIAEELYDFFASVIEADDHLDRTQPEIAETDRKVRELLGRTRQDSRPGRARSFLALVRDVTGESVDAIAASMDVTPDFLVDVSEHGTVLPLEARKELVRRARATCPVNESEALAAFDASPTLRRAASRDAAYAPSDVTYLGLVNRSSLSADAKRLWSGLA